MNIKIALKKKTKNLTIYSTTTYPHSARNSVKPMSLVIYFMSLLTCQTIQSKFRFRFRYWAAAAAATAAVCDAIPATTGGQITRELKSHATVTLHTRNFSNTEKKYIDYCIQE